MDSMDTGRERFEALEQRTEPWKPPTHARAVYTCPGERRRRWCLLWLVLLLWLASPVAAVTRYVSVNDGLDTNSCNTSQNKDTPKQHLNGPQGAIACMGPGDKLYLRGGTYPERLGFLAGQIPNGGGTWETATTIAGFSGETAVVKPPGGLPFSVIELFESHVFTWILFENLEIDGSNNSLCPGCSPAISISSLAQHIRFSNMNVHDGNHNFFGGGEDIQVLNSHIHHGRSYGFYFSGHDSLFEGNDVHDMGGYGFHIYNTNATNVSNNVVRNNRVYNNGFGTIGPPPHPASDGNGILVSHGTNNQVYNNLVYGNLKGIEIDHSCVNCLYYNNTVYNNKFTGILIGEQHPETIPGFVVLNNLVINNGLDKKTNFTNPSSAPGTLSNNMCNVAGTHCNVVGNAAFANVNAVPPDFHLLTSSDAKDAGVPIAPVSSPPAHKSTYNSSFYGVARAQGAAWDIGADEFIQGGGAPPRGQPIYVSQATGSPSNDCVAAESQSTPKQTIADAWTCMTVPGKIMFIKAGTYSETMDTLTHPITGGNGPSFANATTIEGFGSDVVTIQVPVGGFLPLFMRNPTTDHHIVFRKLIFDSANRPGSNGPSFAAGVHHIRFENCEIKNSVFETVYISHANFIEFYQSTLHHAGLAAIQLEGTVDGFLCQQCTVHDAAVGINWNLPGTKTNIVIRESTIRNNRGNGIDAGVSTGAIIRNTLLFANGGIGTRIRPEANGLKYSNNMVTANGGAGVQCDAGALLVELTNTISYNNATAIANGCSATLTPP